MKHYQAVTRLTGEKIAAHEGHRIRAVSYRHNEDVMDYAIECVRCNVVLADWERKGRGA